MKKIFLLLTIFIFTAVSPSLHFKNGGWVSSGGELFKDAKNPWFVRNTKDVNYCVAVDTDSVSASTEDIYAVVAEGFQYWRTQFATRTLGTTGDFVVATQNFTRVDCALKPELTLQFGYATLSAQQIAYLQRPEKYIGVTVRTDYDLQQLKGKGFIYFSSDIGPHIYDDDKGALIPKAWSHKKILQYAVLHELGHVFGLPHMGAGLMSEVFLNQILNKQLVEKYEQAPIDSFIQINRKVEVCNLDRKSLSWFGAPNDASCVVIESFILGSWKVYSKKSTTDAEVSIGEFQQVALNLNDLRAKPSMYLQLSDEQKVFTGDEANFRSFLIGPMMMDSSASATYFANGSSRPQTAYINFTPQSLSVQGISQNKIELIFAYNSPLAVLLLMPPTPLR